MNSAPISAPTTVPSPPVISVPPMIAAATKISSSCVGAGRVGSRAGRPHDLEDPDETREQRRQHEVADHDLARADAGLGGATRFPPTETVYRPQRVNDRTTWRTITIPTAQISSE